MEYLYKWLQFIKERFNPMSYLAMIFVFLGAHYFLHLNIIKQKLIFNVEILLYLMPLALGVFLFFFKLRLFDEVKDIESDRIHHPERPLPRGILKKDDILKATFAIIVLEIVLFGFYGLKALTSVVISIIYSLVMYKEFFSKKWLRLHLTTYAVTHTFVVFLISSTIFISLYNRPISQIPGDLIYFSFAGWFLFNIFEFGRKTFARQEEKDGVNSYSKVFGKFGAVILVLAMAALSIICIDRAVPSFNNRLLILWLILTGIAGFLHAIIDRPSITKTYRSITYLYIILTYGTVMIFQLYAI